jgi:isoleucyl-tRNA synthetase
MLDGVPPYKALLTHGFTVDAAGYKMSKSRGNVVVPQEVAGKLGAEILRLWAAATDYSGELSISDEILKRVVESYRRIRNTLRFLLANTSDFDVAQHALPAGRLLEIDRYAVALSARLQAELAEKYASYEFHVVVQKLQAFCSEDMGAFYLDILKDRLYTCGAASEPRRSAQTALWHITHSLVRLMAPILSFTAEELWHVLTGKADDCFFFHTYDDHALPAIADAEALLLRWQRLRELRAPARKQIEDLRIAGKLGSSLQAEIDFRADGADYDMLSSLGEDLRFVMLTSAARVHRGASNVEVRVSQNRKCERCWHYRADVNDEALCGRCQLNLNGPGEPRSHA